MKRFAFITLLFLACIKGYPQELVFSSNQIIGKYSFSIKPGKSKTPFIIDVSGNGITKPVKVRISTAFNNTATDRFDYKITSNSTFVLNPENPNYELRIDIEPNTGAEQDELFEIAFITVSVKSNN